MASRPRPYWKGFLRLSLVSIAVEVFNAEEKRGDVAFHQIHKPTGKRVNYSKIVEGVGKIETADIVKGFEIEKDEYVILEPEEIEAVRLESKRTVDLVQFVDREDIDPRYFEQPYYILPADDNALEGYLVIREALRKTGKIGLGQMTSGGREHLVAVTPLDQGLMMERLRYADEIKTSKEFFGELGKPRLDSEMVGLATELIERKASSFDPSKFKDSYETELRKIINLKSKGKRIVAEEPEEPPSNVVNLMDALRKSLKSGSAAEKPARKPAAKRRSAAR